MLVFFVILVLIILLVVSIRRFSNSNENYRNLDFVNLSNPEGIQTDIIDDAMAQEIIITNSQYAFYKKEVKRTDFLKILKEISSKNGYTLKIPIEKFSEVKNIVEPITLGYFKKFVLDQLSILVHDYDQKYGYHHIWFEDQSYKLDSYKNYRDSINNLDYFKLKMIVARRDKTKVFNISVEGIYDLLNDKNYIIDISLIGLTTDDYSKSGFFTYYRNKLNEFDNRGVHCSISNSKSCKLDNLSIEESEEYKKKNKDLQWELDNSKCFFKNADSKVECLSKDINGATGIWDTKCKVDTDCPFFGSNGNLNYSNKRGKCMEDGYCELPLNMTPIGYRLYRKGKKYRPLCHNCEVTPDCIGIECSMCCETQSEKGLNPDYAFNNDIIQRDRTENKKQLESKNLKVFDIKIR